MDDILEARPAVEAQRREASQVTDLTERALRLIAWGEYGQLHALMHERIARPLPTGPIAKTPSRVIRSVDAEEGDVEVRGVRPLASTSIPVREPVRVLLVQLHAAVREAIAMAFEKEPDLRVAGEAASLAEAREKLHGVDIAVIDPALPDGYGCDLIRELREASPQAQALVLSATVDRAQLARAVERGAAGVLDRTTHLDDLVRCVRRLHAGETLLPPIEVVELLREAARERDREREDRRAIARLTPREHDVLALLAEGLDSHAVTERLHITGRTERNHTANILAKLGVHSQLQAVLLALRYGLVEIG